MRVRYIADHDTLALIKNKIYDVISIEKRWYRIMTELDEDYLFPPDAFELVKDNNSEILNAVIDYLGEHLDYYSGDIFYYDGGFLRATEDKKTIYIEWAESEHDAEHNIYEDSGCYDKSLGVEQIIDYIIEEFSIGYAFQKINVMPFKEIKGGDRSIYDHIEEGYTVPEKVIRYLQIKKPDVVCMGLYEHPFKPGLTLCGPYLYSDGKYTWDRDAWKYVVKYHVTLPQDFIDYVMSDEGTRFMDENGGYGSDSFYNTIETLYDGKPHINGMPKDAGDLPLDEF